MVVKISLLIVIIDFLIIEAQIKSCFSQDRPGWGMLHEPVSRIISIHFLKISPKV
jgi:hypothetical protein